MKKVYVLLFALSFLRIIPGISQYTVLHSFTGADGSQSRGSLTVSENKLYGMTYSGGANEDGCIFSIDTNGNGYSKLLDFNGTIGANPYGSLTISGSMMYGMTSALGTDNAGNVFSIDTNGSGYTVIFNFDGPTGDSPYGSLLLSGNTLYGTTVVGGYSDGGVIFSINTNGSGYNELYQLGPDTYFGRLEGSFILSGNLLYGMSSAFGTGRSLNNGYVFSINTSGSSGIIDLFDFNDTNVFNPQYDQLLLSGSKLYGMTNGGGTNGDGVIFSVDTNGSGFKILFDFNGTNGSNPNGSVTISDSILYGMTETGGVYGDGIIFSIDTNGTEYADLFDFSGTNGKFPVGSLTLSGNTFYGMTSIGGANDSGVIFSFKETNNISTSIKKAIASSEEVTIYPNPNNGSFTLSLSNGIGKCNVEIYNVLGEKIYIKALTQTQDNNINFTGQLSGIYLYRVLNEYGGLVGEGKVVVQK